MIGPRTENSLGTGDNNTQIGHNTGTIHIGLTFEQHEAALERALARKQADLERAHEAERALIQRELDSLRERLRDIEADYQSHLRELAETKALLMRYDNQIDRVRHEQALAALDRGETELAETILTELAARAAQRRADAAQEEARLIIKLAEIAEGRVDWAAAAAQYARAAALTPDFSILYKAREFAWRMGDYPGALRHGEDLLRLTRAGDDRQQLATALNEHALTLHDTGRYAEAEPLYREALDIWRETLGPRHPNVATNLNNLAELLRATGRYADAEPLFREALEITRETLGPRHPDVAQSLNNLAGLLQDTGRYAEAEPLFREALEITRETLGPRHPDVAIWLHNLATLLAQTNRPDEATPLFLDSLGIFREVLGDAHPNTRTSADFTLYHLRQFAPDHPDLPALTAAFP